MALRYYINRNLLEYDVDAKPLIARPSKYHFALFLEFVVFFILLFINSTIHAPSSKILASDQTVVPVGSNINQNGVVLGEAITPAPTSTPTPLPTAQPATIPSSIPTIPIAQTKKRDYKIAVYGDSLEDTMGEILEYLEHTLKRKYPGVNFTLYNFGKGAENVEMGLNRFGNGLNYQDRHYPPLSQIRPDILIIGSYAYNPFSPYDRDRHWLGLTKLVKQAQTITDQVYVLAEIAPLRGDFGKGPNGVNWDSNTAFVHSGHIIEQLENAVALSRNLNLPLIDVFNKTISGNKEGNRTYVNPSDGIHPSVAGHEFTADIIASALSL